MTTTPLHYISNQQSLAEMISIKSLSQINDSQSFYPRSTRETLSILFVFHGSGQCKCLEEEIYLREKTVYTRYSDCFTQFDIEDDVIGYLVTLNTTGLSKFYGERLHEYRHDKFLLDNESAEEINWVINRIQKEIAADEKYCFELVQKYVSLLLLYLKSQQKSNSILVSFNRRGTLFTGFFSLLEDAFMKAKTVEYYAGKLCVTAKHLSSVIKMESGFPTSYHINQRIILEAKRKIETQGACLKEIAYDLGYEDVSAFSKLFKRVTGETFSDYKCKLKFAFETSTSQQVTRGNKHII
jgi:AraC-like DNA-binding protein